MSLANTGEKTYRILVFGSHSAGKTSIINMLTGEKNRVSNSIEGTTFSFKDSIYVSKEEGDKNSVYKFRDTIGLNNDFKLEISSIEHLKRLIIESHEGYNLLIHVKRMGAIVNTDTQNYELIVENLFDRAQNAICVITEAENLDSPETWWRDNKAIFERNHMIYCDGIAVCSASSTMPALEVVYAEFRKKYKQKLWDLIKKHLSDEPFFPKVQTSRILGFFQKFKLLTDTINFMFSRIFLDDDFMQKKEVKRIKGNPVKNEKRDEFVHIDNTSGKIKDLYLHALLCKASKGYFKEYEDILNSNRWYRYVESNTYLIDNEHLNGYSGVAFMLKDNDGFVDEIAFAHRGTQFDIFGKVLADIKIACMEHPNIVDNAVEFQVKVMNSLAQTGMLKQTTRILHTGFSLGGYIAAACALKPIDPKYATRAITLDAPGLVLYHEVDNIINYVTIPNLVNTCNRHVGEIIQLYSEEEFSQYDSIKTVEIKNLTGVFDEVNATLASHNLEKLIDIISRENYCASEVLSWPVAQRNLDVNVLNELMERLKKNNGVLDTLAAIDDCISNINYFRRNYIVYKTTEFD